MEGTCDRRRFLGAAAMTMVATQLGIRGTADAQSSQGGSAGAPLIPPGTSPSWGLPHGMATTHHDVIDADLLAFIKA